MPRLKSLPPRYPTLGPRLTTAQSGSHAKRTEQRSAVSWRHWYSKKRWIELRREFMRTRSMRCEQTGVILRGDPKKGDWNSPVLDHIKPHRGDPALFWDRANLQLVSKQWHDTVKKRQENTARSW